MRKSRKPKVSATDKKLMQKLKSFEKDFKILENHRLKHLKSRERKLVKRIQKGVPKTYPAYSKELHKRLKDHLFQG